MQLLDVILQGVIIYFDRMIIDTLNANLYDLCTGCGACVQICPLHCICLKSNTEGFGYPTIEKRESCINCGKCDISCPVVQKQKTLELISCFTASNMDSKILRNSSSGGVFFALSEQIINKGGVVFGVKYTKEWSAEVAYSTTLDGLADFQGSKYVQAFSGNSFVECEQFLKNGRLVLFFGVYCQIAGLLCYLKKEWVNLITVAIACHGVPSPLVWDRYLSEIVNKEKISSIKFRDKTMGAWRNSYFSIYSNIGLQYSIPNRESPYYRAFLNKLIERPSCSNCMFRLGNCHADMVIGDFWGTEEDSSAIINDDGTSVIFVYTQKGVEMINSVSNLKISPIDEINAVKNNDGFCKPKPMHRKRKLFFSKLCQCSNVSELLFRMLKPSVCNRILNKIKVLFYACCHSLS